MNSYWVAAYALIGFVTGVVINRAADNLPPPDSRSLLDTPRCLFCGARRGPGEQSGLFRFLLGRSRCSHCRAPLPLRAPLVELGSAILFGYLYASLGPGVALVVFSCFTALLLLITVIDLEHRLILNVVVLPAIALALVLRPIAIMATKVPLPDSPWPFIVSTLLGAFTGLVVVFGIYLFGILFAHVVARARGRAIDEVAFGMGDVKLAGLVGALVGFTQIFQALFFTILLGGFVSLLVLAVQLIVRRRYSAYMAIPYGPFFTVTAWTLMLSSAGVSFGV